MYPLMLETVRAAFAELDKKKESLVVAAVHELIPFDDEEREMVDAEIRDLGEWLGVPVVFSSGRR